MRLWGRVVGRLGIALGLLLGCLSVPLRVADATGGSITLTSSSATVAPGAQVTLTAGMPVVGAGTVSQEIVQTIDPTKVKLTSAADISYPAGWTLSYSTDGTSFTTTAPATTSGWGAVRAVKATGNINSQGAEGGFQIATGTATGSPVSITPGNITASGAGDGFQAFFDPGRTLVFNVFHHFNGMSAVDKALDCHIVLTGNTCPGFPYNPGIAKTSQYSTGRVVGTKIWIPEYQKSPAGGGQGTAGFRCVDISAVLASGGNPTSCPTAFVGLASGVLEAGYGFSDAEFTSFAVIDGVPLGGSVPEARIWGLVPRTGNLVCLDTATAAACSGMPTNGWGTQVKGGVFNGSNGQAVGSAAAIAMWGDRIYVKGSTEPVFNGNLVIGCVLASDPTQPCPGFGTTGKVLTLSTSGEWTKVGRLTALPDSSGSIVGMCLLGDTRGLATSSVGVGPVTSDSSVPCWDSTGTAFTGPVSLSRMVTSTYRANFSQYQFPVQKGSRVYWSNGVNFTTQPWEYPPRALCWDAAVNDGAGGFCAGMPTVGPTVNSFVTPGGYNTDNYTVTPDPEIDNCLWVVRHDQPNILAVDIGNNTVGCVNAAPVRATFSGGTVVPRMACAGTAGAIRGWKTFTLTSPAASANFAAFLSIRDSTGGVITGWNRVSVAAGAAIDISSLDPVTTGSTPSFLVDFVMTSGTITSATAEVKAVGDAPQLCLRPTAQAVCPSGSGPLTSPTSSSMSVSASGSATDSSSNTTPLEPVSSSVTISAATSAQCGATLSGTATLTGTSTGVAGATVTLLDSSGHPVLVNGSPVTTTTGANGAYSFGYVFPGTYKVRFADTGTKTATTATVTAGGSGTTTRMPATVCISGTSELVEDPTGVGVLRVIGGASLLDRTTPANIVNNGDFSLQPVTSAGATIPGSDIVINVSNGRRMPGWTHSGGGSLTYARWYSSGAQTPDGASGGNFYFGNHRFWATSPAFDPSTAFSAGGVTQASYTFSQPNTGYGDDSSPVTISQVLNTTVGRTYRLQFWQASEPWGSRDGIAALELTGYSRTYFRVKRGSSNWQRYTFEFVATSESTSISFRSWGHVEATESDELRIDDVIVNRCGEADLTADSGAVSVMVGSNGVVDGAYVTPAVAVDDVSSGLLGAVQTIDVKANDTAATGNNLTSPTIRFCSTDSPPSGCSLTTKTVSGQGTYTLSGSNVVFTPCSGVNTPVMTPACAGAFTGTATPVGYQITDSGGQSAVATITPSVVPPPTAVADAQTGAFDTNQAYSPAGNDSAGSGATLVASSVRLCPTSATSPFTTTNCSASSVTTADGVYSLNTTTGVVTFDPVSTFTGTATVAVRYVVQDSLNQVASSTITPTVTPPGPSVAGANSTSGVVGAVQTVDLLADDTTPSGVTFASPTTRLCAVGVSAPNCGSTSLDVPNVGSYSLSGGTVTFTPCGTAITTNCPSGVAFTGTATPVGYQVTDSVGRTVNSTYTPTVVPPPVSSPDGGQGVRGESQTITLISNDTPGAVSAPLLPASIRLCDATEVAPNCTKVELSVPGEGSYRLNPNGTVTFEPEPEFEGIGTPQRYVASDELGQVTTSTIVARVVPPPAPITVNDTKSGPLNQPIVFDPAANDRPGTVPPGQRGRVELVRSSLRLCLSGQLVPNCAGTELTTADGTYKVDPGSGLVTFTPREGFEGEATQPVTYQIANDWTGPNGAGIASAVITPIVGSQFAIADDSRSGGVVNRTLPTTGTGVTDLLVVVWWFLVVALMVLRMRRGFGGRLLGESIR